MSQEEVKDFVDRYMPAYFAYRSELPDLHICDSGAMGELMETIFQIDQLPKIVGFYARLSAFSGGMT